MNTSRVLRSSLVDSESSFFDETTPKAGLKQRGDIIIIVHQEQQAKNVFLVSAGASATRLGRSFQD